MKIYIKGIILSHDTDPLFEGGLVKFNIFKLQKILPTLIDTFALVDLLLAHQQLCLHSPHGVELKLVEGYHDPWEGLLLLDKLSNLSIQYLGEPIQSF